jgi:hypothetical protein
MEKLARSADPKQQTLRDLKKSWQKEMKVFIAQSIALKRGIAGRGDAQAGLPPSNIKDPLPPEISTYIEEMSTRFNNLSNIAKQIVEQQSEYSQTRRKSQKEVAPTNTLQAAMDLITKRASTPLSRIWSIWTQSPWFKDDKATKARLRLLSSMAELQQQINDVEFILAGQDKQSITHAFFSYLRFLGLFRSRIIIKLNQEIDRQRTEFTGVKSTDFDQLKKTLDIKHPSEVFQGATKKLKEKIEQAQKEDEQAESQVAIPKPQGLIDTKSEEIVKAKEIVADIQSSLKSALAMYNSLVETKIIPGDVISDLSDIDALAKELIKIGNEIVAERDVDFKAFENGYKELLGKILNKTNQKAKSFEELVSILSDYKKGSPSKGLEKIAHRSFERWMRRMKLSLYWDEMSKSKLDTVKKLRDLSIYMDSVMDLLEGRDTKIAELFTILSEVYKQVAVIAYDFVQFAQNYNTFYGQQQAAGGKRDIGPINQSDIGGMANEYKKLVNEVDELLGKSISGEKSEG